MILLNRHDRDLQIAAIHTVLHALREDLKKSRRHLAPAVRAATVVRKAYEVYKTLVPETARRMSFRRFHRACLGEEAVPAIGRLLKDPGIELKTGTVPSRMREDLARLRIIRSLKNELEDNPRLEIRVKVPVDFLEKLYRRHCDELGPDQKPPTGAFFRKTVEASLVNVLRVAERRRLASGGH